MYKRFGLALLAISLVSQDIPRLDGDPKTTFLLVCDTAPSKIIVLDDNGKWLHRVKEAEIKIDGTTASIRCTLYEGHYRPTSPDIKIYRLSQVKSISESDFQTLINNLQDDPTAVKRFLSGSDNIPGNV